MYKLIFCLLLSSALSAQSLKMPGLSGAEALTVFPDGSVLMGGMQNDCIRLLRFTASGSLSWAREICAFDPKRDVIGSPIQLEPDPASPGSFFLIFRKSALSGSPENLLNLLKFDANGTKLWETQLRPEKRYGALSPGRELAADADGSLWIAHAMGYTDAYPDFNQVLLFKTDAAGQVIQRRFFYNASEAIANGVYAMEDGGALIYGSLGTAVSDGFFLKVDTEGQILWSRRYKGFIFLRDGGRFPDGDFLMSAQYSHGFAIARIRPNGDPVWAASLNDSLSLFQACIGLGENIVLSARRPGDPAFLFEVEPSGNNVLWANAFENCTKYPVSALRSAMDGGFWMAQNTVAGTPSTRLLKVSADGELSQDCPVLPLAKPQLQPLTLSTDPLSWTIRDAPLNDRRDLFGSADALSEVYDCCPSAHPKAAFDLPDSVCVKFPFQAAALGQGCEESWRWEIAGKSFEGAVLQDLVLENEGVYAVKLHAYNGICEDEILDSIRVVAQPGGRLFPVRDTVICPDHPLVIAPDLAGYEHWTWYDGGQGSTRVFDPPQAGRFSLSAAHGLCAVFDTLTVALGDCGPDRIYAPNVFAPGSDGDNANWEVFPGPGIEVLECSIYDRWGERCYQSGAGQAPRWDGNYGGKPVSAGVMVWMLRYRNVLGDEKWIKGSLLLIK